MNKSDEKLELNIRPRSTQAVTLLIPADALASLKQIAQSRDMSLEALLKLYIGQGLRQDVSKLFGDRVMEAAARVLARHLDSDEEISAIIREIRVEASS